MAYIYLDSAKTKRVLSDQEELIQDLNSLMKQVDSVRNNLRYKIACRATISARLQDTARQIGLEAQRSAQMRDAFSQIVVLYQQTETKNLGLLQADKTTVQQSQSTQRGSTSSNPSFWELFKEKYGFKDFFKGFGNAGKIGVIISDVFSATSWNQWTKIGISAAQTIAKVAKDVKNYQKIGRAIGTKNAVSYFVKKQVGLRKVGHASTFSNPRARFYNNLHNTTSPYNMKEAFSPLTGAKGVKTTLAAWAGVALTGVTNLFGNIEEQKQSNGTMSTGRVVAETISETAIDTIVTYGGAAVVGAAIAAVTGVVAAPVVVAAATGIAIAAINAGVQSLTGKTATEWVSDAILDTAVNVGKGISNCAKAVGKWFSKLSFA